MTVQDGNAFCFNLETTIMYGHYGFLNSVIHDDCKALESSVVISNKNLIKAQTS